jgi:prepilin peptidase CpaA
VLCTGGTAAAAVDIKKRRIPNPLCLALGTTGLVFAATGVSGISIVSSLAGLSLAFLMMMPGHLLGSTGAGDVKLFAAAGTLLGVGRILEAFLWMAVAGGALALLFAWRRGRLRQTMLNTARLFGKPREMKAAIESPAEQNRFPYGPAIALGCVMAMLA